MPGDPSIVRALVLDCDGVLTDGSVWVDDDGRESRRFSVRDGFGIALWQSAWGLVIRAAGPPSDGGLVSEAAGASDKAASFREVAARLGVEPGVCAFIGDDWPDLPAMAIAGYPIAVADAAPAVRAAAAWVTTSPGGGGAVRESIEHILAALGRLAGDPARFAGARAHGTEGAGGLIPSIRYPREPDCPWTAAGRQQGGREAPARPEQGGCLSDARGCVRLGRHRRDVPAQKRGRGRGPGWPRRRHAGAR